MPSFDAADIAAWTSGKWEPDGPAGITGVSHDTRDLQGGNLYVAIRGLSFDGHDFVAEAAGKGACGAVVRNDWQPAQAPAFPLLRVPDTGAALRDMAGGYRRSIDAEIIGVTGSAGKTTVKEMIAETLAARSPTARTWANWNNDIGLPLSLLRMDGDVGAGVFEVGTNHPGELRPLCELLAPSWGVVTNVGPVHIEFFDSVDAIADEKAELLRCLPPDGTAVLDRQGAFFDVLDSAVPCRTVTVALDGPADYACVERDTQRRRAVVEETATRERVAFELPLPGEHNVLNAMFAVAVARGHGMDWQAITKALAAYQSLPMRWEVRCTRGVCIINDAYNANPMSVRAAVAAWLEQPVDGKRWLVLSGMLELGDRADAEHAAVGGFVAGTGIDALVTVGELGAEIARAAGAAGLPGEHIHVCPDTASAGDLLASALGNGDSVLLKASRGMHLEKVIDALIGLWGEEKWSA